MKLLKARETKGRLKVLNKKINSFLDTKEETHIVTQPSPERVMKSCLKCLTLEAPEVAKKPLLSLPSHAQLVSNL